MIDTENFSFLKNPYAITVCRIEPENNISLILKTFSHLIELPLVMIGNWQNNNYGIHLLQKYKQFTHLNLLDPIYDPEKLNFIRSHASIYIHGHSAGGTNPSLVEAMFLGLPIFAFDCIYNRYTTENQCMYWASSEELYNCISQNKTNIHDIGNRMKQIANEKYRWKTIVAKYEQLYR
jgi:glycosyltransferase involved in cell wall biosynthesis